MKSTSQCQPHSVLYRRRRSDQPLARKVICASSLFCMMVVLGCIVVFLPQHTHACFQESRATHLISSSSTASTSSSTKLATSCARTPNLVVQPQSQLSETAHDYQLHVFTPGVPAKQLQVDVDRTTRLVRVVAQKAKHAKDATWEPDETESLLDWMDGGCYIQQWHVDESVHLPDLVMAYRDGVLLLSIPKKHADAPTLPVEAHQLLDQEQSASARPNPKPRPSSGPFIKGTPPKPPRVRGVFPAMGKNIPGTRSTLSAAVPGVDSLSLPPSNIAAVITEGSDVPPIHSIRGGGSRSSEQHALLVKQPSHGLVYRVSFDPTQSSLEVASTNDVDAQANPKQFNFKHLDRASAEEEEYWFHKM